VLPSIGSWMRNTEIRNAAESIQNGLNRARAEAVKRNEVLVFSLVSHNAELQVDGSCALSSGSASWIVSVENPAGKCDVTIGETLPPFIVARQSQGEGSPNVSVSVGRPDAGGNPCGTADTASTSVAFNGYGRVPTTVPGWASGPVQCIVVAHTTASDTRPLNIVIGSGGTVRMCDPAVTSNDDPRKC
jgi:type IV fimbrial biogenesis protein FimT